MSDSGDDFVNSARGIRSGSCVLDGEYLSQYRGDLTDGQENVRIFTTAPSITTQSVQDAFWQATSGWFNPSSHENVVTVYDRGRSPRPWVAVETVDGARLGDVQSELSIADAHAVASDTAEALRVAGLYNATHGSLSPTDIWVTGLSGSADATAVVDEWGLERACRVAAGERPVSLFTAPELVDEPTAVTDQTDVYGLGAITYYALTGEPPFTIAEVEAGPGPEQVTPPSTLVPELPSAVDDVILTALAPTPGARQSSPSQFGTDFSLAFPDGFFDSRPDSNQTQTASTGQPAGDDRSAANGQPVGNSSTHEPSSGPQSGGDSTDRTDPGSDSSFPLSRRSVLGFLGLAGGGSVVATQLLGDSDSSGEPTDGSGDESGNGGFATSPDPETTAPPRETPTPDEPSAELDPSIYADKAQEAWEVITEYSDSDASLVRQAHVDIEEAVRDSAIVLNFMHDVRERFWYDHVDVPKYGTLGPSHQRHTDTQLTDGSTELNLFLDYLDSIDPIESDDEASSTVITQLYEPLVNYPDGVPELNNLLIEGFELSEDQTTYTFTLKEGVTFHDGTELTAQDVKYSWRRVAESENSIRSDFLLDETTGVGAVHETASDGNVVPDSLGVRAVDDYTLKLELETPNPDALDILTYPVFSVVPEGIVGDIDGYTGDVSHEEFRQNVANGTGPFTYGAFTVNEEFRVTRFEEYHAEAADIESIHWNIVGGQEERYALAIEKEADIFQLPTQYYDPGNVDATEDDRGREVGTYGPLDNGETVNYLAVPELVTRYFGFNARNVPIEVRRAVAYVLDQQAIVDELFASRGVPAYSFTPPGIWPTGRGGYEQFVDEYPYSPDEVDVESAREVLDEGGFTPDDPFDLTVTTFDIETYVQAAEDLRDHLAGNGVEIDIDSAGFGILQERGYNGNLEMYSLGWGWSWDSLRFGHYGFEPKNTDTSRMPEETDGYYLDWQTELSEEYR